MPSFRVDPTDLRHHAHVLARSEPFTELADAAALIPVPVEPTATSGAVARLRLRLHHELIELAAASGSLVRRTRIAADQYAEVESSISRASGR